MKERVRIETVAGGGKDRKRGGRCIGKKKMKEKTPYKYGYVIFLSKNVCANNITK